MSTYLKKRVNKSITNKNAQVLMEELGRVLKIQGQDITNLTICLKK